MSGVIYRGLTQSMFTLTQITMATTGVDICQMFKYIDIARSIKTKKSVNPQLTLVQFFHFSSIKCIIYFMLFLNIRKLTELSKHLFSVKVTISYFSASWVPR